MNQTDQDEESLFISFYIETKLTRIVDKLVLPTKLSVRADVNPRDDATEAELNKAFTKIRFWFESLVTNSLAFAHDNPTAIAMLIDAEGKNRTDNLLMITPGEPTDEVIAALFQSKMAALSGGDVEFNLVEIKSDNAVGLAFTFLGSGEKILPTMTEWLGTERSFFEKPWWSRNDASMLDTVPAEDADLTTPPTWAYSLDTLGEKRKDTGVIIRPEFKPTVLDGGKKDDE